MVEFTTIAPADPGYSLQKIARCVKRFSGFFLAGAQYLMCVA